MHLLIREACVMVRDTVVIKEMIFDIMTILKKYTVLAVEVPAVNVVRLEGEKKRRPQSFALTLTDVYIGSSR